MGGHGEGENSRLIHPPKKSHGLGQSCFVRKGGVS